MMRIFIVLNLMKNLKYLKQNLICGISDRAEVTLGAISDYNGSISFNFNTLTNLNSVEFEHSHNEMTQMFPTTILWII